MRYTEMFLPTLREVPTEAEVVSHRLMFRAGMIRKLAAGIYSWLPFGLRVLRKVENIIREEMDRTGAQEVLLPGVQPAELWRETTRWEAYGKELLRLKDRHERDFCLGPTHEEVITDLVRNEVRSYRQLPLNLYQIQTKFRDEIRPRFGVMRGREFGMKDAYSFDADEAGAEAAYQKMFDAYTRIFERCGLSFRAVEAVTGAIGGKFSHEFMVLADTGEDQIAVCEKCGYAANLEKAELGERAAAKSKEPEAPLTKVPTPGQKTVEEVCAFLKVAPALLVKTLIFDSSKGPVAALVRGDRELNPNKLEPAADADWIAMAGPELIEKVTGGPLGFSGPVGLPVPVFTDREVAAMKNFVTGANAPDMHYTGTNPGRDFDPGRVTDLRVAAAGDPCPRCEGTLQLTRGIEVGHVFKLGTKYSKAMRATYLDADGKEQLIVMGCYGIGTGRTVAAAIEQNHDQNGISWPVPLAPFQVYLLPINLSDEKNRAAAEKLYADLQTAGLEALYDDRVERPGVKFKDADLLGIPLRIVVGEKTLAKDSVEFKLRREKETRLIKLDAAAAQARQNLNLT